MKPKQLENGKWRVQIMVEGKRYSKTFSQKTMAQAWARDKRHKIQLEKSSSTKNATLWDLAKEWIERYADQRNQGKRDTARLTNLLDGTWLGNTKLKDIDPVAIAKWRDERLKTVTAATVRRDWTILSTIVSTGIIDMGWLKENPFKSARRPPPPPARDRLPTDKELEKLDFVMGDSAIRPVMWFAIETAMSAGEIAELTWGQVHGRVVKLPAFKTRPKRDVPLSTRAVEIMGARGADADKVFGLTSVNSLDALWRKYRDKAGIYDLHFHDLRHLAITRLAQKLEVLDLARMVGHRDIRQLMTYYNESAENIAKKLD